MDGLRRGWELRWRGTWDFFTGACAYFGGVDDPCLFKAGVLGLLFGACVWKMALN